MRRARALVAILAFVAAGCTEQDTPAPVDTGTSDIERRHHALLFEVLAEDADRHRLGAGSEDAVAACMAREGFDYLVRQPPTLARPAGEIADLLTEAAALDPGSAEFRERFGYGISTLRAYLTIDFGPNPNDLVMAEASSAERAEFRAALLGREVAEAEEHLGPPGGCLGESLAETDGHDDYTLYATTYDNVQHRLAATEAFHDAETAWAQCAAEQGYDDLATPADIRGWVDARLSRIDHGPTLLAPDEDVLADEGSGAADPFFQVDGSPYRQDELAEVQQEELALARRLQGCDQAFTAATAAEEDRIATELLVEAGVVEPVAE